MNSRVTNLNGDSALESRQDVSGLSACGDGPCVMELAAYVDGRASPERCAAIEAHLAVCAICREALDDTEHQRLEATGPFTFVPSPVLARAMALVPAPVRAARSRFTILSARAAALAAALGICTVGHLVGASMQSQRVMKVAHERIVPELLGEPDDSLSLDDDLLALAIAETRQ